MTEIVAVRTAEVNGHTHIAAVKLAGGNVLETADLIAAIGRGERYRIRRPEGVHGEGDFIPVGVRQCPNCLEDVIFA